MKEFADQKKSLEVDGFSVVNDVFTDAEVEALVQLIENANDEHETFRKSKEVFAIRQFLKEIPHSARVIFNNKLKHIITTIAGADFFVVKSIYFDKPATSNWFVSYHQDLTISVDHKLDIPGFGPWTVKQHQFAVQPPVEFLERIITLRIHLDDTTAENGAIRLVAGSHLKKICRPETIDWTQEKEVICSVPRGAVMLMKPLTLHSSGRTTNNQRRRVIHIELSNQELPSELQWSERQDVF
jgi:ectoine hydroxylase-related dioxygenase (phytanoyl-CoA dioxygenase family)